MIAALISYTPLSWRRKIDWKSPSGFREGEVQNLLAKDMANTTVINLLDRNMDMRLCIMGFQFFGGFLSRSNSWILRIGAGLSFVGGVLRDQNGEWILGYNYYLGECSVFDTELLGILDDLILCQKRGLERVMIHTDNSEVIIAIQDQNLIGSNSALESIQVLDKVSIKVVDVLNIDTANF
ncbi:hypothetical protein Golob_004281, partial [Gossypium lobatum]|nr:hypothetical protein [Gossypium lobatum]